MSFLADKKHQTKCGSIKIWIPLIIVSILFSIFATLPATTKWFELKSIIVRLEEENKFYESELSRKKLKLSSIENEFNKIAKEYLREEKALFPKSIDTNRIARVLELFSLQYSLIDSSSEMILNSVSFSKQESEKSSKTSANISLITSKDSLKDFIYFIQENKIPEKLFNAQNSNSSLLRNDISTSKFIKDNILPVANIESISSSKSDSRSEDITNEIMEINIQVNFFSQKMNNE